MAHVEAIIVCYYEKNVFILIIVEVWQKKFLLKEVGSLKNFHLREK